MKYQIVAGESEDFSFSPKIADVQEKISSVVRTIAKYHAELLNKFSVISGNKLRIKE
jgi:hypothetical protein